MMAKKPKAKMGWTAVYDACPDVDGKAYPTRKAVIEAHGAKIVGECSCGKCGAKVKKKGVAKIVRKEFPAKPKPAKKVLTQYGWAARYANGKFGTVYAKKKDAMYFSGFAAAFVERVEIRPAKGAKRAE